MGRSTGQSGRVRGSFDVADEDAAFASLRLDYALYVLLKGAVVASHIVLSSINGIARVTGLL